MAAKKHDRFAGSRDPAAKLFPAPTFKFTCERLPNSASTPVVAVDRIALGEYGRDAAVGN